MKFGFVYLTSAGRGQALALHKLAVRADRCLQKLGGSPSSNKLEYKWVSWLVYYYNLQTTFQQLSQSYYLIENDKGRRLLACLADTLTRWAIQRMSERLADTF